MNHLVSALFPLPMNGGTLALVALGTCLGTAPALAAGLSQAPPSPSPGQTENTDQPGLPSGVSPSDWSSIHESISTHRHSIQSSKGGFEAHNPGFGWQARFDGTTALIQPSAGDWSFGLALRAYGFEGEMQAVDSPDFGSCVEGQEITYGWSNVLSEWWINDSRGFEHGFTVHERPVDRGADDASPLVFELDAIGSLHPSVNEARSGLNLSRDDGGSVLRYSGLVAYDATGLELPAWLEVDERRVRICVDESSAAYPILVDPVVQGSYLKASNTSPADAFGFSDQFGSSVAISGDTVVVGAPGEDSVGAGVNGSQLGVTGLETGSAYVFVRSGTSWVQQAYLKMSYNLPFESWDAYFGGSVAISGDTIVVGASGESSNATGVNGDDSDSSMLGAGAAYVFVRSGTTWSQQAYLKASNTEAQDNFGDAVAISGDTIVVGASREDSGATGINGNQSSNSASKSGAAYVFVRSGTTWSQQAYLKASNAETEDDFGEAVAVSGNTIVVGAADEDSVAVGINGNESSNTRLDAGAAYVFQRQGSTWTQQAYLKASNTDSGDSFGLSVAVSGNTLVVGGPGEDSMATGVNGDQSNSQGLSAGAAYVYTRSGATWSQQAYLKASNTDISDQFGGSVSASGDTVVVGAFGEDSSATGIDGDQSNNATGNAGAAYVFVRSGASWTQAEYLKASATDPFDQFGRSVAVSGDTLIVGAIGESSCAQGVDGDPSSNLCTSAGAAYTFEGGGVFGTVGTSYCQPNRNSTLGFGRISAVGSAVVAEQDLTLVASGLPTNATGIFLVGDMSTFIMNPGGSAGNVCVGGNFGRFIGPGLVQNSGASGSFQLAIDLLNLPASPGIVASGDTWFFQAWHRDVTPTGGVTSNYTDGLEVLFN